MLSIFLSYTSRDHDLADRIRLALVASKHKVFFDRHALAPGQEFDIRIARAIEQADLFIFLITPDSVKEGHYTLTELGMAQQKWNHPDAHVLPVMIRSTPIEQLPPYLKAVTILTPAGDIPAEVAAEVRRRKIRWPSPVKWGLGGVVFLSLAILLVQLSGFERHAQNATKLLLAARSFQAAEDYPAAWTQIQEARAQVANSPFSSVLQRSLIHKVASEQIEIAVGLLDNLDKIYFPEGQSIPISDVVKPLLPVLDEAILGAKGQRKADLLAHRGWGEFWAHPYHDPRNQQFSPEPFYRRALQVDPTNVYAHTMWGYWLMTPSQEGTLANTREHFNAALASGRLRPYVRGMQLAAMSKSHYNDEISAETLHIAHDMILHNEPLPVDAVSYIWSIYHFACGVNSTNFMEELLTEFPATDLLKLLRELYKSRESSSKQYTYQLCLARLYEKAGMTVDALKTYQTLLASLTPSHGIKPIIESTIARLSRMK